MTKQGGRTWTGSGLCPETFVNHHAIEQTQLWGQRRVDGVEPSRHRADAVTGTFPHRFWYCVWRCRRESAERYRPQQPPSQNGSRKRARSPEPAADEDDEWAADLEEELFS